MWQDMARADLMISHAGAGTIIEALGLRRRLVLHPTNPPTHSILAETQFAATCLH